MVKNIQSADNVLFKETLGLQQKKQREKLSQYLIEGPNLLREALDNQADLRRVFMRADLEEQSFELKDLFSKFQKRGIDVCLLSDKLFEKLGETMTPQGVLGVVKKPQYSETDFFCPKNDSVSGNLLVLDRLQDPGNLGTILRTADAAKFQGAILCKGTGDIFSPKVVRSAAGALFRLPVFFTDTPEESIYYLRKYKKRILAAVMQADSIYYRANFREEAALVIGNEGNGICEEFIRAADETVCIPMNDRAESLNAAVAAGILMYETVRQRAMKQSEQ